MLAKSKNPQQLGFYASFEEQLNHKHGLYILAGEINWELFEQAFSKHYSSTHGAPAKPIRRMVGLLILKQLRNLSDESVVEQWSENSYFQYFTGEECFCSSLPCSPTELVEFRKRIGEEGVELIFQESIRVNGKDADEEHLSADTTIQEKNITFPTDDKLNKKIIKKCQKIAEKEHIKLRQSYRRTLKRLCYQQRMKRRKGGDVIARKASKKIKTIAGRLTREIQRKLSEEGLKRWGNELCLFEKVLKQKKSDKDKIYSIHEPNVKCYSKGKEYKKYEFGSKVSIMITQKSCVIVAAKNFNESIHDNKTIESTIAQYEKLTRKKAKHIYLDRNYQGRNRIGEIQLHVPKPDKNITKTQKKRHRRRAAIEPVIGHLKKDYRMLRNYLKGNIGDTINVMLAAAAYNFKRIMNKWKENPSFFSIFLQRFFSDLSLKLSFFFPIPNITSKIDFLRVD